jgi:hypothetical protein
MDNLSERRIYHAQLVKGIADPHQFFVVRALYIVGECRDFKLPPRRKALRWRA